MAKDTFYFSHDYYARKDPKCVALIQDFGASGYGLYWCLIEIMYEQGGKIEKFPSLFSSLAKEFGVELTTLTKQIEAMLHDYSLLQADEKHLWSDSVLDRLAIREDKKQVKAESGRLGGIKSGESRRNKSGTKQNEAALKANEANEAKKRKEKERKGNIYSSDFVDFEIQGLGSLKIQVLPTSEDWQKIELVGFLTNSQKEFQNIAIRKHQLKNAESFQKLLQLFVGIIQEQGDYKNVTEYKRYFSNWLNSPKVNIDAILATNGEIKKSSYV